MKTLALATLTFLLLFFTGCDQLKGPAGPTGPAGASGADALTDPSVGLKVIWTDPPNGQVGQIPRYFNFVIRFNKILDKSTVNKSIQISPLETGYVRLDTNNAWVSNGDIVYIGLSSDSTFLWVIGQTYTITVMPTLKDINGNSLSTPYSFSFTPEPALRVTYTYPSNGRKGVNRSDYVELDFNNRINISTLQSSISISPVIAGTWRAGLYGSYYAFLTPTSQLDSNTVYTVTLGTGIKDEQGRSLSSPYTFSFTTGQ